MYEPATDGSAGAKLQLYTPGAKGSVLLNGASTVLSVAGSYKTNFAYTPIGADAVTYGIEGLIDFKGSETDLWTNPANGEFKFNASLDSEAGASKWK